MPVQALRGGILALSTAGAIGCASTSAIYGYYGDPLPYVDSAGATHRFEVQGVGRIRDDTIYILVDGENWSEMNLTVFEPDDSVEASWNGSTLRVECAAYHTDTHWTISKCRFWVDGVDVGQVEANRIVRPAKADA